MRVNSVVIVVVCALTPLAGQVVQRPAAPAGSQSDRAADLAAIEKLRQIEIAATIARDPVALSDYWTDDAIRLGLGQAEVGKPAIRASNERHTANKGFKVLSYIPKTEELHLSGWCLCRRVAYLHGLVCRVAGWRAEEGSWHCAVAAQEASGRQLESLPCDGGLVTVSCRTDGANRHAA